MTRLNRSIRCFCLLLLLLGAACMPKLAVAQSGAAGLDSVVLERTSCFGTCPAYRLSIARSGHVSFQSRNRGDTAFHAWGTVPARILDTIARRAERTGFFDLP